MACYWLLLLMFQISSSSFIHLGSAGNHLAGAQPHLVAHWTHLLVMKRGKWSSIAHSSTKTTFLGNVMSQFTQTKIDSGRLQYKLTCVMQNNIYFSNKKLHLYTFMVGCSSHIRWFTQNSDGKWYTKMCALKINQTRMTVNIGFHPKHYSTK